MATVHLVLANVGARGDTGAALPVFDSAPIAVDTVTSSASSALAGLTATGPDRGEVWHITAMGGNVWVNFGAGTPVAGADAGWLVLDGQPMDFAVSVAGEKVALKDA
jgi:hypothetical protein